MTGKVLIIGSAPDATRAVEVNAQGFDAIVAVNNAWRIRDDWTHLIHPEDLAIDRMPAKVEGKTVVTYRDYVPANNSFGGIIYAGATMAFTAGYWALHEFKPDVLAFIGCDMIYNDEGDTHFYGDGEADPLRKDPTLQNLEAKSNRLKWIAALESCWCVNLSEKPTSRLTFDRLAINDLSEDFAERRARALSRVDVRSTVVPLKAERKANQFHASGDYWNAEQPLDSEALKQIDSLWLALD